MLNEVQEFRAYTAPDFYGTNGLGRFTLESIRDFLGFERIFTILARGYLFRGGDPYDNVEQGIKALHRLTGEYNEADLVAMCWNCGETGARKLWEQGIYSTEYSRKILAKKLEYEKKNRS